MDVRAPSSSPHRRVSANRRRPYGAPYRYGSPVPVPPQERTASVLAELCAAEARVVELLRRKGRVPRVVLYEERVGELVPTRSFAVGAAYAVARGWAVTPYRLCDDICAPCPLRTQWGEAVRLVRQGWADAIVTTFLRTVEASVVDVAWEVTELELRRAFIAVVPAWAREGV